MRFDCGVQPVRKRDSERDILLIPSYVKFLMTFLR